jgi:phage terminase large subunit-like protein
MPIQPQQPQIQLASILEIDDPVTHYAQCVASGEIVAGPHVRAACSRHLRDLQDGAERGLVWDVERARYAIGFFPAVLRLNGGQFEGKPFELELWQGFIVGSLFGWYWESTGYRRFQIAYIETGKGSGKSPLAAGIGLYGLVADGENRAEIYAAATKKDQAMILFRDAVAMVDQSPDLDWRLERSGSKGKEWNLAYHDTNSFFRPISADEGQSGPRPHIGLIDEVHEHKSANVVEMIRAGFKFRTQPMIVMITNSGTNKKSVCWEYHQFGAEVSAGMRMDDTMFAYICALDEDDNPLEDESCWIKANPSLGVTITYKYLRDQVTQARGMPAKESLVKRLNFCMWVEASSPWISYHVWQSAADDSYDIDDLRGRTCYGGLDLSSTSDLTVLMLAFEPSADDPYWRLLPFFWIPEIGLADKAELDNVDKAWLFGIVPRQCNQ